MYVLMDMEWITNRQGRQLPTQLSALRVDGDWQTADTFSTLFYPQDISACSQGHVALRGWKPKDFMEAPKAYQAFDAFQGWLRTDDILCWWHQEAGELFDMLQKSLGVPDKATQVRYLGKYVREFMCGRAAFAGSPYKLCRERGIRTPAPEHCSDNDVRAMQMLLEGIGFPQEALSIAPAGESGFLTAQKGTRAFSLLYDPETALLHYSDCELLPDGIELPAFSSFKSPIRARYKPCRCCRGEYLDELWTKNKDTIARTDYNYVYSKQSGVFHRRDCPYILLAYDIQGSVKYDTCIKKGRRPCRHCRPDTAEIEAPLASAGGQSAGALSGKKKRSSRKERLTEEERHAIGRLERAKRDRAETLEKKNPVGTERNDLFTLTHPGYAFWAGVGCQSFHLRNCPKLAGTTELRGFRCYQDAVRAGHTPCRKCRPSKKQDAAFSIPISSEERSGENEETLALLCREHGVAYECEPGCFKLQTAVGRWKIELDRRPVHLEHINLVMTPQNTDSYHIQPRLFLSLRDTFDYIMRHDKKLLREAEARKAPWRGALGQRLA